MGLRCNKVERTVWWFLAPYTSLYPSSVPLYPLPILPAPEDVPLSLPSPCLAAEGLLRGVDHVEEAVLVPLLLVDLGDGCGHGHHAVLVDQQEEGLRGVQLQPAPGGGDGVREGERKKLTGCYCFKYHSFSERSSPASRLFFQGRF